MTDSLPVTLVTRNASQDALSDSDYIAIIDSLRGPLYGWSWQRIADETGYNSKAWWSLVAQGKRQLDDEARNALRRITDGELPEQPPSVTDVTQRMVHPDAEMLLVGTLDPGERVRRVLLMAANDATVHVNGTVSAEPLQADLRRFDGVDDKTHSADNVTHVDGAVRSQEAKRKEPSRQYYRPALSIETKARIEKSGKSLQELIDMALEGLHE